MPTDETCPIARSLSVLGQKWNLLLLREAFLGSTKFAEFQRIGVPPATLGARLEALVEAGLFERQAYRVDGERSRDQYVLTAAGRDTIPVLAALSDWGGEHLRPGPAYSWESTDGRPVRLAFIDADGDPVDADSVMVANVRHPRTT
jgi:DNA-binding HxlR family transcriptional regulator